MSSKGYLRLFLEAVVCGFVVVILGYVIGWATKPMVGVALPEVCAAWNDRYVMEINLFLIGFVGHLLSEITGANHWYCKNGYACNL